MASGQQTAEQHDTRERQGDTAVPGGAPDNNLERLAYVHRGGQTKGEHLGAKGYKETKAYQETDNGRGQTEQQRGTGGARNNQTGQRLGGARGDPTVQD